MNPWKHFVTENPMMEEVYRNNRRLSKMRYNGAQIAAGAIAAVIYLFFMFIVWTTGAAAPPQTMLYILMGVLIFVLPISLHGVISGEREKRSLEMLMSAPVTSGQIVAAKFLRGWLILAVSFALFIIPAILLAIQKTISPDSTEHLPAFIMLPLGSLVILAASVFIAALSINVSSWAKNTASSMVIVIGLMFSLLVIVPFVWGLLSSAIGLSSLSSLVFHFNPMTALAISVQDFKETTEDSTVSQAVLYAIALPMWLIAAGGLLYAATVRLDKERK